MSRHVKADFSDQSRVTINHLSQALGLTKGTVSRALNGYPDISERTRLKVQRTAERMGYQPLSHAQAIRTGRSRSMGLVIQTYDHDAQRPFLAEFLAGISVAAASEGWTLTVTASDTPEGTLDVMRQLIKERKADGFILPRTLRQDPRVDLMRALKTPFVLFGRVEDPTECAWYDIKGGAAMHEALGRLVDLGHRRIAYVGGGQQYNYQRLRYRGYRDGLESHGFDLDNALVHQNAVTRAAGAQATRALLELDSPPTGIIYAVDAAAAGAWDAAQEFGLTIGKDLSVVTYDGTGEGANLQPALASYAVDIRRAGERLTQLLIRRIRGEDVELLREEEPAQFRPGGSLGPAPATKH